MFLSWVYTSEVPWGHFRTYCPCPLPPDASQILPTAQDSISALWGCESLPQWCHIKASQQLPTALLCPDMVPTEPGPPVGSRPNVALACPHLEGGAQCPGLGLPQCLLAAPLLSRVVGWDLALVAPSKYIFSSFKICQSVNFLDQQLKKLWEKYGKAEITSPRAEEIVSSIVARLTKTSWKINIKTSGFCREGTLHSTEGVLQRSFGRKWAALSYSRWL